MALDLKACMDAIAPYNFVNQKAFKDVLDILMEYMNENSKPSIDVDNTYIGENTAIDGELVKIYLDDIYTTLKKIQTDPNVTGALDAFIENYPKSAYVGLLTEKTNGLLTTENGYNLLFYSNDALSGDSGGDATGASNFYGLGTNKLKEYLYSAKAFKQRKGSVEALEYAYNIIRQSGIQPVGTTDAMTDTLFNVDYGTIEDPTKPFYFRITGSLIPALYENAVVPIAHPLGFGYEYVRLLKLAFLELDMVKEIKSNYDVKVVCDNGRIVHPVDPNTIIDIKKEYDDFGDFKATVYLTNNTKIVRDYNSTVVVMDNFDNVLIDYPDSCALYMKYDIRYESAITINETVDIYSDWGTEVLETFMETQFDITSECVNGPYNLATEDNDILVTEDELSELVVCFTEEFVPDLT